MAEQGGRIWATSDGRGRGSTFHVEIPVADGSPAVSEEIEPALSMPGERYRILVVEDHEPTRATLTRLLARRGHEVETAGSIATARVAAQRNAFDLVISDVGLPDGDGRSLMRELYAELGMPGIALSGYGTDGDVKKSLEEGFGAHLTKPIDLAELDRAIASVMQKHSQKPGA
jgi:DNA-binding response OmpR family regulator